MPFRFLNRMFGRGRQQEHLIVPDMHIGHTNEADLQRQQTRGLTLGLQRQHAQHFNRPPPEWMTMMLGRTYHDRLHFDREGHSGL